MTSTADTRLFVADYVNYRLQKQNLRWPTCPELKPNPGHIERTMRALGDEFEVRYAAVFQEMCKQLYITPNNAHSTFITTVNELFRDGVKWGRVVALFAFTGSLAVKSMETDMPMLVDQVIEWTANYVETDLKTWIQLNGSWDGFVEFYEGKPERKDESPWPSLSTICGCALGAIGVLTLGALFTQKF